MEIIDAHQHFWRISRGDYTWMDDSVAAIRRDFLPADLIACTGTGDVVGTVVVQAAASDAETDFLLSLAADSALIKGVVGWMDLSSARAPDKLAQRFDNPVFKGVRPMLQDIEDTHWLLRPEVMANLAVLAERGGTFDALVTPRHLPVLLQLAKRLPQLPIVIDHCAKPVIAGGQDAGDTWRTQMRALGDLPNVWCKLSGLANEYGPNWSAKSLAPVCDWVLQCFGTGRLMWGSDWPVLELAGSYAQWCSAAKVMTAQLTAGEQQAVFAANARRFYQLPD